MLAVSGGQLMANLLEIVPDLEAYADLKIVAVTSPQLFEELRQSDPQRANAILSPEERNFVITLHNGWRGFLYPFLLPANHRSRALGIDDFSRSGRPREIYQHAAFDPAGLRDAILHRL